MKISPTSGKELRSRVGKIGIGKVAAAFAFALLICSVAVGPARADDHGDRGDRGHRDDRGDRGYRGPEVYVEPAPDYYYQPQPDYYYQPEPDYYYSDRPRPEYYPRPQSEGLNLFFGVH
jgi:hypothetical protein